MFLERCRNAFMADADAQGGGGTSSAGVSSGNVDVNELVNQVVGKRVKKAIEKAMADLRGELASVVKEAMAQKPADKPADKPNDQLAAQGNNAPDAEEKLTLKTLKEDFQREKKARLDLENRLKEADAASRNMRMRTEAEKRISAKLGADNPLVPMFMDSFYDGKKRVVEQDGNFYVKFKDAIGDEELRPLDDGINALFDKGGEYAHLVTPPSKVSGLPPRTVQARGTAAPNARPSEHVDMANHPIYGTVAQHLRSHGDGNAAAGLEHVASLPANGSDQK